MWNYSFIFPDLIILFTFIIYYFIYPRLPVKINRSFLRILAADLFVILSDVCASVVIEYACCVPPLLIRAINVLYFILFMLRIFVFFMFTEDVMEIKRHLKSVICIVSDIVIGIFMLFPLLNLRFDIIFSISETGKYARAPFYNVIYVCAAFFLAFSFVCIFLYRKKLDRFFLVSVLAFNLAMVIGYIVRVIMPNFLILNIFTLLAIVIIFISFENPIMYLAGKTNAFNKRGFYTLFSEFDEKDSPLVLGFIINNYNELREVYSGTQMDRGIVLICQYLSKVYPNLLRFYLHDGHFILVGKDNTLSEKVKNEISERFKKPWSAGKDVEIFLEPKFIRVDPNVSFKKSEKIANSMFFGMREAEKLDSVEIIINRDTLIAIEENILIKRSVEKSVENNSVEMFLQPLMDSKTYRLVGAEALARIRDESGNLIPPGKFIPIAEKNGRISCLGEQMFEKACKFIHEHNIEEMGLCWINVNLSPIQFLRPDLNSKFTKILEKYNVPADLIHLEITEESMIDYALLQKQIQTMRNTGFQFVLDDYGSGYSNVSRLRRCPFVNIKLDMELVRDYAKNHDNLLPTIVHAFKQMGFTITAEGIETWEIVKDMVSIGCDYLQGFYFSKPLPADEFAKTYGKR